MKMCSESILINIVVLMLSCMIVGLVFLMLLESYLLRRAFTSKRANRSENGE